MEHPRENFEISFAGPTEEMDKLELVRWNSLSSKEGMCFTDYISCVREGPNSLTVSMISDI